MSAEEWKMVCGWEDLYEVSNLARVRSLDRSINTKHRNGVWAYRTIKGRVLKQQLSRGYLRADLRDGIIRKNALVHRLVAIAFIPNSQNKPCINHIDGNPSNNSISNLEWCTHQENMRHAGAMGLMHSVVTPGEGSHAAKLNNEKVKEIKKRLKGGEMPAHIAKDYGVVEGTIGFIKAGKTWAHI